MSCVWSVFCRAGDKDKALSAVLPARSNEYIFSSMQHLFSKLSIWSIIAALG